ncbi:hypothetical protein J6590_029272 [Homalodisca vitripennis]|nr:hypothetical protein J6590_029272 [Homalodisca vitripennis]
MIFLSLGAGFNKDHLALHSSGSFWAVSPLRVLRLTCLPSLAGSQSPQGLVLYKPMFTPNPKTATWILQQYSRGSVHRGQLCKPVMVTSSSTLTRQGTGRQSQYYTVNITQLCKPVMITSSSTLNTTKDTQTVAVSHCQYRSAV